ncbi:MAG: PIN domain-containing protein [Myxococcaceae bacterium]
MNACFVDTWGFVALANRRDAGHELAREVDEWLAAQRWVLTTSDWVLDETVTQLHALGGAPVSLRFLELIDAQTAARTLQVLNVSRERFVAALDWFRRLAPDVQRLSLTDCTSFALMEELDVRWAFTADRHFYRAGAKIGPLVTRDGDELRFRAPAP